MSEGAIPMKKMIPIIVITWVLSLVTTLVVVYVAPNILPIRTTQISDEAITTEKIVEGAIITTKLADGTVTSAKILDGTITALDLDDGCIMTVNIDDGAVTTTKIASEAVTTTKIADGAVVTIKLADSSVTSAKIDEGAVTTNRIADGAVTTAKIADYAVTNLKLAPNAIPFASTYRTLSTSTTETASWTDMSGMSVTLTLDRTSQLLIMFSAEVANYDGGERIHVRALVGASVANPGWIILTPIVHDYAFAYDNLDLMAYSYNFYESVIEGTYTVKIQWQVSGGTGYAYYRTLTVIALPA